MVSRVFKNLFQVYTHYIQGLEMAQWLRAFTASAEDLGSAPMCNLEPSTTPGLGDLMPLLTPQPFVHM